MTTTTRTVAAHAAREGYREVPVVSPGGKATFYFRRNPDTDHRQWILWNRLERRWMHQDEDPTTGTITAWPFWIAQEDDNR